MPSFGSNNFAKSDYSEARAAIRVQYLFGGLAYFLKSAYSETRAAIELQCSFILVAHIYMGFSMPTS